MLAQERQRDPLEAEADAGGVRQLAVARADVEVDAEVVLVVVDGDDRGRPARLEIGTTSSNFSSCSRWLACEHAAGTPEERIVGGDDVDLEPERGER